MTAAVKPLGSSVRCSVGDDREIMQPHSNVDTDDCDDMVMIEKGQQVSV